jgi:hypothetical protein
MKDKELKLQWNNVMSILFNDAMGILGYVESIGRITGE